MSTALDTEHFRQRLVGERQRAQEALRYLQNENQGLIDDEREEIQSDNHPGDAATATFDRELDSTLEENEERMIAAIDAALKRIEDGTFGRCSNCGEPIPAERLEALPWATQCIGCKRREERG
ncbi:MAG TPA: TraR/DksA C4-type zinc finger protein [Gaiellaceae bacterium]